MYVVNFYFNSVHLKAPFYYPYDVPAMFFVFLNLYLAIQKRWGAILRHFSIGNLQ